MLVRIGVESVRGSQMIVRVSAVIVRCTTRRERQRRTGGQTCDEKVTCMQHNNVNSHRTRTLRR